MEEFDNIHYTTRKIDGYNMAFNFIISSRDAGKSTYIWVKKVYKAFKEEGRPSVVLRRKVVHITEEYIKDISNIINKFTDDNVKFKFSRGSLKDGIVSVYIGSDLFIRVIGLSVDINQLKSACLPNIKYMIFDEFISNPRYKEKYLTNEASKFMDVYDTYMRESKTFLKCYFMGNPYSLYNPYFLFFGVDSSKLKLGVYLTDNVRYVVEVYQVCEELKQQLLKKNPLYQVDNDFVKYAFNGEAVLDKNIPLWKAMPNNFSLNICFKLSDKYLGVYKAQDYEAHDFYYFVQFINPNIISKRRDVYAFDFDDMVNGTQLITTPARLKLQLFKSAMAKREVVFNNIECYYLIEEIYQQL